MKKTLMRATMVAFCAGLCTTAAYADPAPTVQAIPAPGNAPQQWRPDTDSWARIPEMPNLNDIPAIPFPTAGGNYGVGGGQPIGFNKLTGLETLYPATPPTGEVGGQLPGALGADGQDGGEVSPAGFGTMSILSAATRATAPWRMNAKMAMRWVNNGGGSSWFVASGSMVDSRTFLTAGHCVYSFGTAGIPNSWAADIYVFPGWDGNGNIFGPSGVYQQYGFGSMTHVWSWTGWTQNGNWDNDVGLVGIDRAVGQLTGWYGTAWGFDCATIRGRTYNNAAYPAEGCGTAGLHNGQDMTYWFGQVDDCPNNQMTLFTTAGCYTAVWGGMSGSGMYYIDGSNRFVHGICSTSNRTTRGNYCKQWQGWFDFVNGPTGGINTVRGTAFDLQALQCRTSGSTSIRAGESGTGWSFLTTNSTNNDPASRNVTFRVYLSSNTTISSTDTLLTTLNYTWDYAPNSNVTVNVGNIAIPSTVPAGTYYIGVILDPATDGNSGNNDTSGWDAQQVTILPASPDNNACANAIPVSSGTIVGTTANATLDGTSTCGFPSGQGPDVWYSYTATCSGPVTFDTIGSNLLAGGMTDTVLSLHSNSCPGNTGNQLACDDDAGGNFMSRITYDVVQGTTYKIRVCGYNGRSGAFQLNVTPLGVSNDTCASAATLLRNVATGFTTCTATNSPPLTEPQCNFFGQQTFGKDIWYRWVADRTGTATVSTCTGTNYDTKIAAYANCPSAAGQVISCNDDACALQSRITFACTAGQSYIIRVGGYTTAAGTGSIILTATCKPDYNADGVVDLFDYLDFVADFAARRAAADYNTDGVIDFFDYLDFVADFAAGCGN
jgi:hypothetical protein